MKTISLSNIIATTVLLLSAVASQNATAQAGNIYSREQVQTIGTVQEGVVLQVNTRQAEATWQARSVGATLGSAAGFLLARNNSNNGSASVLSSMLGGLVGERVANQTSADLAQEIIVKVNSASGSSIVSVVQPAPFDAVEPGQAVLLVQTGGRVRVVKRL